MTTISKYDDMIDSRDVIVRIEELQGERDEYGDEETMSTEGRRLLWAAECPDDAEELAALESLAAEAEGYCADWQHGEALIRDSYFQSYAQELAEDIGAIDPNATWPANCIDWEQAARELQMDYTSVEFDGVTYWTR